MINKKYKDYFLKVTAEAIRQVKDGLKKPSFLHF